MGSGQMVANALKVYLQFLSFVTYIGSNRIIFATSYILLLVRSYAIGERGGLDYAELVIPGSSETPMSVHLSYLQFTQSELFSTTRGVHSFILEALPPPRVYSHEIGSSSEITQLNPMINTFSAFMKFQTSRLSLQAVALCISLEVIESHLHFKDNFNIILSSLTDRLCGLVVRVLGHRSRGPGSIPGTT
jgi:hypothetical protein